MHKKSLEEEGEKKGSKDGCMTPLFKHTQTYALVGPWAVGQRRVGPDLPQQHTVRPEGMHASISKRGRNKQTNKQTKK